MAIIDSQVHADEASTPKRPWHSWPPRLRAPKAGIGLGEAGRIGEGALCRRRASRGTTRGESARKRGGTGLKERSLCQG